MFWLAELDIIVYRCQKDLVLFSVIREMVFALRYLQMFSSFVNSSSCMYKHQEHLLNAALVYRNVHVLVAGEFISIIHFRRWAMKLLTNKQCLLMYSHVDISMLMYKWTFPYCKNFDFTEFKRLFCFDETLFKKSRSHRLVVSFSARHPPIPSLVPPDETAKKLGGTHDFCHAYWLMGALYSNHLGIWVFVQISILTVSDRNFTKLVHHEKSSWLTHLGGQGHKVKMWSSHTGLDVLAANIFPLVWTNFRKVGHSDLVPVDDMCPINPACIITQVYCETEIYEADVIFLWCNWIPEK